MRRHLPGFLFSLLAVLPLAACEVADGGPGEVPFASALAVAGILDVDMAGALAAAEGAPQPGAPPPDAGASVFRDVTLQALATLNADLSLLRAPLEAAAGDPGPASPEPDVRTWRAPTGDGDGEVLLEVRREPGPWFTLALAVRPARPADAPWQALLAGTFTPSGTGSDGQGALWADLSADLDAATAGTVLVLWSREDGARELAVFGYGLTGGAAAPEPRDTASRFREDADGSGDLLFQGPVTLPAADGGLVTAADALIYSRWNEGADGRVDVKVAGSVAEAQGYADEQAIQCWKTHGKVTTFDAVEAHAGTPPKDDKAEKAAKESALDDRPEKVVIKEHGRVEDCPFLEPSDAQLPARPAEPPAPALPDALP